MTSACPYLTIYPPLSIHIIRHFFNMYRFVSVHVGSAFCCMTQDVDGRRNRRAARQTFLAGGVLCGASLFLVLCSQGIAVIQK